MGVLIQDKLIRWILQPLAALSNRLPARLREVVFVCAGAMTLLWNILLNAEWILPRYLYTFSFGCLMSGIMLFCTLPAEIRPIRFDRRLLVPWYGFTLFMLISGLTNSVDYLADTMLFLVMFPVFYIVWNNGDFHRVLQLLTWTCRVVLIGLFIVSILLFPVTGEQYLSCFTNPNGLAVFLTGPFCFFLLSVLAAKPRSVLFWVDLALLGLTYAFIYYSNSRTGQIAAQASLLLTILMLLVIERKRFWRLCVTHILPILLSLAILHSGTLYIFQGAQQALIGLSSLSVPDPGSDKEPSDAEKPVQPSVQEIWDRIREKQSMKNDTDRTFEQVSSARSTIWMAYLKHISFWGHSLEDRFEFESRGAVVQNTTAHMVYLDLAYKFGVLCGVLFLAFNLAAGFKSIAYAARRPEDRWALAPLTVSLAYGATILVASALSPYSYMIALCYFLVQSPLMAETGKALQH